MLSSSLSPNLGTKRRCLECEAAFYDLNRDPITCPKCGAVHQPVARLKSDGREPPKGRTFTRRKPAEVAAEPAAEAPEPPEGDLDPADEPADEEEAEEHDEDEDDHVNGEDLGPDPDERAGDEKQ